ncbi:glutamate racemase [Patescibacteria group bacterium]|nr:MAG: glutamate racemase [Patescibacteria group bacterium]
MVGIFDSGVGGLTFVKALKSALPNYSFVYFGDTARVPYGNKDPETIKRYSKEAADFLLSKGADVIVAACHTVSALAGDSLRENLKVPFFDVMNPLAETVLNTSKNGRIGIIGTKSTIKSLAHKNKLEECFSKSKGEYSFKKLEVFEQACPLFVPLIEEGFIKRPETKKIIRYYLRDLKLKNIDTLVLACTHYPLLNKQIQSAMGKNAALIDPAEITVKAIIEFIKNNPQLDAKLSKDKQSQFFVSDDPERFANFGKMWLDENIKVQKARFS